MRKNSLRASSPFGDVVKSRHARGTRERGAAPRGFASRSRVLPRLTSLAQIGELARRLEEQLLNNNQYKIATNKQKKTIELVHNCGKFSSTFSRVK